MLELVRALEDPTLSTFNFFDLYGIKQSQKKFKVNTKVA